MQYEWQPGEVYEVSGKSKWEVASITNKPESCNGTNQSCPFIRKGEGYLTTGDQVSTNYLNSGTFPRMAKIDQEARGNRNKLLAFRASCIKCVGCKIEMHRAV